MEIAALHAEMKTAFTALQDALTAGEAERKAQGDLTADTKAKVDRIQARLDQIDAQIERKSREVKPGKAGDREELTVEMSAQEKFLRYGKQHFDGRASAEEKAAFGQVQTKALSAGGDTQGGIFTPEDFRLQIIKKIPNFSHVVGRCNVQPTSRDTLRWPTITYSTDDVSTSAVAVTWEDEDDSVTETDFAMGSVAVPIKKARALIKVPVELLEDTAVDIIGLITSLLAEAYAVDLDRQLTNGAGGKKPEGFMTNSDITLVVNGHATTLQYDGLMDFIYALPEQYAGQAVIMVKRSFVRDLRKLKDSQNRPLWEPALTVGAPSTFAGYPVVTNEHMPAIASSAKPAIFADFNKLVTVGERVGMTIKRLDEKYADTDQVGFIARRRVGAKVVAPWAARKLHMST